MIHQLAEMRIRGFVASGLLLDEFSFWVHSENMSLWNANFLICVSIVSSVAERSVERPSVGMEEISDIRETGDLKNLWLLLDHLPV